MMKYILNNKQSDDIDMFFSSMAATVRKFPPRQRALAKAQVFSVVSKLEIEILSQPESQSEVQQHPATAVSPCPSTCTYSSDSCSSQVYNMQIPQINMNLTQEYSMPQAKMPNCGSDFYNNFPKDNNIAL